MNEFDAKIIELSKNDEKIKIEPLLEERLKQDPNDVETLLRFAKLELFPPFADYFFCFLLLERAIITCKKHASIAETTITHIKKTGIINKSIATKDGLFLEKSTLTFFLKHLVSWFYEGVDRSLIDDVTQKIISFDIRKNPKEIKSFLKIKTKQNPNQIEPLFLLALIEMFPQFDNLPQSVALFEKMLSFSKESEALAVLIYAYIKNFCVGMDVALLSKLNNTRSTNQELNSMLKYATSWYYADQHAGNDEKLEEHFLKESINLFQGHVCNYERLAELYFKQGRNKEAKKLMRKALKNVVKVYNPYDPQDTREYDATNVNEFLNELVKGIHLASWRVEDMKKTLKAA